MVKRFQIILFLFFIILLCRSTIDAALVVNEVMANEPGGDTSLEWIEIYNSDQSTGVNFSLIVIDADGTVLIFSASNVIGPDSYAVVCQNKTAFELTWGDGSGVWGDDDSENYRLIENTQDFSLGNSSGSVTLYYLSNPLSTLAWTDTGLDGYSWERLSVESDEIYQCIDPSGSTPGRENSIAPQPYDLELLPVEMIKPDGAGNTDIEFNIANVGLETVTEDSLFIFYDPEQDSLVSRADLIAVIDLPDVDSGETITVPLSLSLDGYYAELLARLFQDDRPDNNTQLFTAPGSEYPPVVLNEFLADPVAPLTEWVELKNRSDRDIDIGLWYLGDSTSLHAVAGEEYIIQSGQYIVLCRDSLDFVDFYGQPDFPVIELTGWPSLHNEGDMIRLADGYGLIADSIIYDSTFGGNFTWGRGEEAGYEDSWGRSADSGGTPGAENLIHYPASASSITVTAQPNPFSPSCDIEMSLEFSLPAGTFSMKLYDIEGRVVKTFADNYYAYDGIFRWNGNSDGGRRLPVGIYILLVDVFDVERYKQTIVIAP